MNKSGWIVIAIIVVLLAVAAGYVAGRRGNTMNSAERIPASGAATESHKVLYWKAPMDPNFHSDKPGKSPMGMDLVPVYASGGSAGAASDVKIDPAVVNNLGVHTVEVRQGSLSHRIEAVGYVGYDENTVISINTRADGWVEKLGVKSVGDTVRTGQLLYSLFSPKLATAEREYLTATASGSKTLIRASRQRMRALGFTTAQIERLKHRRKVSDRVARRAEGAGAGVVINLGISEGAYVKPMTQVMQLADLHTVWILAEIDESDVALLRTGQKAVATLDAFPGQRWSGAVDYIYPDINTATRTAKLRLRFDNPNLRLQPNMYAHITINAMPQHHVVHIPLQALIRTGHSQRVIISLGNGRFDVCPVEGGFTSGSQVEILKGLRAGQRVVTSAQFMLDSEANVNAAALRLGSGKATCTSAAAMPGQGMSGMKMPVQGLKGGGMERKNRSNQGMSDSMSSADGEGKQP